MLVCVPKVLTKAEVKEFRALMDQSTWEDGRSTAGAQSADVKKNEQLSPNGDMSRKLGERVIRALAASPLFVSAAIPLHIFPPLFNRYGVGQHFGVHVDNAVRGDHLTGMRIRTDLSVTLFLSEPGEYDGGELVVEDYNGSQEVKLPAGDLVLYPATSLHTVTPISRGVARRIVLLAAEHGSRCPCTQHDLRSRQCHSGTCRPARPQRCGSREAHRNLPQPYSLLGRGMMKFLRAACVGAVAFIVMLQSIPAPAQQPAVPSGTLQPEQPLLAPPVAKPTNAGRQSPAAVTVPSSLQPAPARPAIRPSVGSPPSPAEPPSAIPDPVRPAAGIGPLRELSPWSMFLSADILVKAVIVGLIFASLVTWTLFLAKTIHLSLVRRDLRSALTRIAKVRTLSEAQLALGAKSNVLLELLSAAMQEVRTFGRGSRGRRYQGAFGVTLL